MRRVGIAVVGCGTISNAYLTNLTSFPDLRVVACADLDIARAKAAAERFGIPVAGAVDDVLTHPDVEIVVNLTIPAAHADIAMAAIRAGRHVYNEKPLTDDLDSGGRLLAHAAAAGVRVGGAPDTFLGAGWQTAYRLMGDGAIGSALSAIVLMQSAGPESWHPSPEFLFQRGAGPLFDIGPYYLTALAVAFGPVARVAATATRARPERVIGSGPRAGTRFPVEVPTHVNAMLEFGNGVAANTVFSFDSHVGRNDFIEISGSTAVLAAPDPNTFGGAPRLRRVSDEDWIPISPEGTTAGRGIGVLEMARAIRAGQQHRACGELALHVLEVMTAIIVSSEGGEFVAVESVFPQPQPLPPDWNPHARTMAAVRR